MEGMAKSLGFGGRLVAHCSVAFRRYTSGKRVVQDLSCFPNRDVGGGSASGGGPFLVVAEDQCCGLVGAVGSKAGDFGAVHDCEIAHIDYRQTIFR